MYKQGMSIVIPTLGKSDLHKLLESIHEDSSLSNHEIIIVSSSEVINKLGSLKSIYNCVKFAEQNFKNVSKSRNLGILQSTYRIISLLDDDDVWLNNRSNLFTSYLAKNESTVIFGSAIIYNQDNKKTYNYIRNREITSKEVLEQFIRPICLKQKLFLQVGNCAFINSSKIPKFREDLVYLEDQIWVYDLIRSGNKIIQFRDFTLKYNFSRNRSSERWHIENERRIFLYLNEFDDRLGNKYIYRTSLKSLSISSTRAKFKEAQDLIKCSFPLNLSANANIFFLNIINVLFDRFKRIL